MTCPRSLLPGLSGMAGPGNQVGCVSSCLFSLILLAALGACSNHHPNNSQKTIMHTLSKRVWVGLLWQLFGKFYSFPEATLHRPCSSMRKCPQTQY